MITQAQKGFSLLELLLVIFIISLVYYLGFNGIEKMTQRPALLTPLTIKETIFSNTQLSGEGTLVCIDHCKACYLREGIDAPFKAYKGNLGLGDPEIYKIDTHETLHKEEYGRFQDHKICLVMHFYPNHSATQMIIKNSKGVYFLPAYFGTTQQVDSLEEAQTLWLEHAHDVSNRGDYY